MKPVSVKFQRKILFIPVVNSIFPFIFFYNFQFFYKDAPALRVFWIFFSSTLPLMIFYSIISELLSNTIVDRILYCVIVYSISLLLGYRSINLQEGMDFQKSHK